MAEQCKEAVLTYSLFTVGTQRIIPYCSELVQIYSSWSLDKTKKAQRTHKDDKDSKIHSLCGLYFLKISFAFLTLLGFRDPRPFFFVCVIYGFMVSFLEIKQKLVYVSQWVAKTSYL